MKRTKTSTSFIAIVLTFALCVGYSGILTNYALATESNGTSTEVSTLVENNALDEASGSEGSGSGAAGNNDSAENTNNQGDSQEGAVQNNTGVSGNDANDISGDTQQEVISIPAANSATAEDDNAEAIEVAPLEDQDSGTQVTLSDEDYQNLNKLTQSLSAQLQTQTEYSYGTEYASLAYRTLGTTPTNTEAIDKDIAKKIVSGLNEGTLYAGSLAKYILVLTSHGFDCTNVTIDGVKFNLIQTMESLIGDGTYLDVNSAAFILPVYQYGVYQLNDTLKNLLIDAILNSQSTSETTSGLFGSSGEYDGYKWEEDTQTTAQVIMALLPYCNSDSNVKDAVDKAFTTLESAAYFKEDGSFKYDTLGFSSDFDATTTIIAAYTAAGRTLPSTQGGKNAITYVLELAADDNYMSFDKATQNGTIATYDPVMSYATALMGLSSYVTGANTYASVGNLQPADINTQASTNQNNTNKTDGQNNDGTNSADEKASTVDDASSATSNGSDENTSESTDESISPETGDTIPLVAIMVIAVIALATVIVLAVRKKIAQPQGKHSK